MTDHNKKLPVDPWSDGTIKPKYGWVYGEADPLGGHIFKYRNINEPEGSSSQTFHPSGNYETIHQDEERKEIKTSLNTGETRDYTAGGTSVQTDGNADFNCESTTRMTVTGDFGMQGGRNQYQAFAENVITASKNTFRHTIGASESKDYETSSGDVVLEHTGNEFKSFDGDSVTSIKGNKITLMQSGDYAIGVQGGNYDIDVSQKGRIKTGNDLLIESSTKLTLKVGNSTIVIESNKITITSALVDFIEA